MQDSFEYIQSGIKRLFEEYDGKMVLKSNDAKTQAIFNKVLSVFDKNKNGQLDADEIKTIWDNLIVADKDYDEEITTNEIRHVLNQNNVLSRLKMSPDDIIKFIKIVNNTIRKSFQKRLTNTFATLMKSYKKKYPENKYKYKYEYSDFSGYTGNLVITNKTTGEVMLTGVCRVDGSCTINKKNERIDYDQNGNIIFVSTFDEKTELYNVHHPISDNLNKDITAKNKFGLPTTGKNFEKHIKQINSKNIITVLTFYQNNYGESLLDAINGEWGLDKNIKASAIKHLNNCLINSKVWKDNKPNTKIDNNFSQGQIGDCWLLSTISAIQRSPKGQAILNNIIKDNKDGTYAVKFKGADKAYTVSALELYANGNFSGGDIDVRILELAAEKYYNILGIKYGGNPSSAFDLLLGKQRDGLNATSAFSSKPNPQSIKKLLSNENVVMTCSVDPFSKLWGLIVKSIPKNAEYKKDIAIAHAYAVYDIDDENIYLKNPWDTSKIVAIPLDVFEEYWSNVQYIEIR